MFPFSANADILSVFLRTIGMYAFILLITRLIGKRDVGKLAPFDFVVAIMVAEGTMIIIEDPKVPVLQGVIPIATLAALQIGVALLAQRVSWFRRLVSGKPVIVIEDGKIVEGELRKLRYNIDDLREQLRQKNFTSVKQVKYAIVETNGKLTVIPKYGQQPVKRKDLALEGKTGLPLTLVNDGEIDTSSLKQIDWSQQKLEQKLEEKGYPDYTQILLASLLPDGSIFVQLKKQAQKARQKQEASS